MAKIASQELPEDAEARYPLIRFILENIVINEDDMRMLEIDNVSIENRFVNFGGRTNDSPRAGDTFSRILFGKYVLVVHAHFTTGVSDEVFGKDGEDG